MASEEEPPLPVDVSLLDGLEVAMSEDEQRDITSLMTSGDPEKLALAATVLSGMADMCKLGVVPLGRSTQQTEAMKALQETPYTNDVAVRRAMLEGSKSRVRGIRLLETEVNQRKRLHPLPSRMPRYAWIDQFDPSHGSNKGGLVGAVGVPNIGPIGKGPLGRRAPPSLTFVDDEWDGSLEDAFSTIKIGPDGTVRKQRTESPGVAHILEAVDDNYDKTKLRQTRVLIWEVHNDAAKKGLRRGDVVTHVNGKAFAGNSQDLVRLLQNIKAEKKTKFNFVVNADLCVAEALRLRALC